jgi:hypothetical protein
MNIDDLIDIVEPASVPWTPQTIGWWVGLACLVGLLLLMAWRYRRHRAANEYRREAIAALDALGRPTVSAVNSVLKRTALTAGGRNEIAALSGAAWVEFLRATAPIILGDAEGALLSDGGYSTRNVDGGRVLTYARDWIRAHRVDPEPEA